MPVDEPEVTVAPLPEVTDPPEAGGRRRRAGGRRGLDRPGRRPDPAAAAAPRADRAVDPAPLLRARRPRADGAGPRPGRGRRRPARRAGGRRARPDGIAAVLTSPLRRARQTAAAVADALGAPMEERDGVGRDRLRRLGGPDLRRGRASATRSCTRRGSATSTRRRRAGRASRRSGARVAAERAAIVAAYPGRTVVVVSHVTPIKLSAPPGPGRRPGDPLPAAPGPGVAVGGRLLPGRRGVGAPLQRHHPRSPPLTHPGRGVAQAVRPSHLLGTVRRRRSVCDGPGGRVTRHRRAQERAGANVSSTSCA